MKHATDTSELAEYIRAENAKTRAWVAADPENRFASTWVEDMAHWTEDGIFTIAQFQHRHLVAEAWECHRDAYGYRASWAAFDAMSDADLRAEIERAAAVVKAQMAAEYEMQCAEARAEAEEAKATAFATAAALNPAPFGVQLAAVWPA